MKKITLSLLTLFLSMFTLVVHADTSKVNLIRQNPIPGSRSIVPEVTAEIGNGMIEISIDGFWTDAQVQISEVDGNTVITDVFENTQDASANIMDIAGLPFGSYKICVVLNDGGVYVGYFSISETYSK